MKNKETFGSGHEEQQERTEHSWKAWTVDRDERSEAEKAHLRERAQEGVGRLVDQLYDLANKKKLTKYIDDAEKYGLSSSKDMVDNYARMLPDKPKEMSTKMKVGYLALGHMPYFVPGAKYYSISREVDLHRQAADIVESRQEHAKRMETATKRHEGILAATEARREEQRREAAEVARAKAAVAKKAMMQEQLRAESLQVNLKIVDNLDEKRKSGLSDETIVRWQEHSNMREFERALNRDLTRVNDIIAEASREGSGVTKRVIDGVDMYELHGRSFSGLQHVVDFKLSSRDRMRIAEDEDYMPDNTKVGGAKMAARAVSDPSVYAEMEKPDANYMDYTDWRRNGLSMTYINTESYASGAKAWQRNGSNLVVYGWDRIPTNRIMVVSTKDAFTSNFSKYDSSIHADGIYTARKDLNADTLRKLNYPLEYNPYNEIAIRRYDEYGKPLPPDYILTTNGHVNKFMLRHAKYWHIPIISLEYNPPKPVSLHEISGKKGSNPGGWYEADDGSRYYVKRYGDPNQGKVECLANRIYDWLGVPVPRSKMANVAGIESFVSEEVPGAKAVTTGEMRNSSDVVEGFVADAFLGNWDVVGSGHDNIMRGADGRFYRIDNGGAMIYRARGEHKAFSSTDIPELESIRKSNSAWRVFGGITEGEIKRQAKRLVESISPDDLRKMVWDSGLTGDFGQSILDSLLGRREYLERLANS